MSSTISMDGSGSSPAADDLSPLAVTATAAARIDEGETNASAAEQRSPDSAAAAEAATDEAATVDADEDQVHEGPLIDRREQQTEWLAQFLHSPSSFHARALHRTIDERGLRESLGLRGIYWRLFLHLLDRHDLKKWSAQIREQRQRYEELAKENRVFIRKIGANDREEGNDPTPAGQRSRSNSSLAAEDAPALDLKIHNPLSLSNPFAADNELSETIKHDLHRTHADRALFCTSRVQDLMFNVLFIWSKTESSEDKGRYRQGMNEILSPIVLVLMRESQSRDGWDMEDQADAVDVGAAAPAVDASPLAASIDEASVFSPSPIARSTSSTSDDSLLPLLLDSRYVEHDVYALFVRVMHHMAPFFHKVDTAPRSSLAAAAKKRSAGLGSAMGPALGEKNDENPVDASPIVRKCNYIHHVLLSTIDPALYTHLNRQDVAPTLYILRWYRVMFSREFHMEDTLLLWDVMFANTERSAVSASVSPPPVNTSNMPDSSFKRALAPKSPSDSSATNANQGQGFLLAEYIVIAMLLYVRQALMHGDNSYCLRRLLRYPPVEDVRVLLARALHFANGWKALTADPTLTRDSWNPAATDHDTMVLPRGSGAGSGVSPPHAVPEGTSNPEAFEGPWQRISGGMGADAPLDTNSSPEPSRGGNQRQQQQQSQANRSSQQQQSGKRGSQSKTLFSDSFASLKSFMKGTLQKAAELPAHPPPASERERSSSQSKQPSPSPTNASNSGSKSASRVSAPAPSNSRKAPTSSGVSHFLSSSSSSPSSTSPHPSHSPIVTGPTAAQHDELILLRKQLAASQKEVLSLSTAMYSLNQQLLDARSIQTQMGHLLGQSIEDMEREYAHSQGEHLANEDGDDEEEQEDKMTKAEEEATVKQTDDSTASSTEPESTVAAADSTTADSASTTASKPTPSSSASAATPSKRAFSEDVLLSGLAEFKHVRDVLVGRLTLPDIIDYLHTSTAAGKKDESVAASGTGTSRAQILSDISSMHARQLESFRAAKEVSSANAGPGASFPYNFQPPKPKAFTPLFETEVAPRDKVSELFALDESDAVPGVYPTVHKVTAHPPSVGPLENVSALSTAAALGALTSPSNANASNRIVDPLFSPPAAAAKSPSAASASATTAAAAPTPSAPSAAASSLLSGLLSSPTSSGHASSSSSASLSTSKSLFDSSPPSSPHFKARVSTGMFGDDDDDAFPSSKSSKAAATKKKPAAFALEEEDDSILLPSASQFKEPPRSFKPAPKKPVVVAAAAAPVLVVSPLTSSAAKPVSSVPVRLASASPLHASSPSAGSSSSSAASTKSVAAEEDPLSWMGTGGK